MSSLASSFWRWAYAASTLGYEWCHLSLIETALFGLVRHGEMPPQWLFRLLRVSHRVSRGLLRCMRISAMKVGYQ